jgi:hypothetical protein
MLSLKMNRVEKTTQLCTHLSNPLFIYLSLFLSAAVLPAHPAHAIPNQIRGLPSSPEAQGDAFVQAWLAFRRDLDSMAHSGVHPALLRAWFKAAPPYLVRDAARLATNPTVFLAAVARLAEVKGKTNRQVIAELQASHRNKRIASWLKAYGIIAGDTEERKRAIRSLESAWFFERIQAAIVLTRAGDEKGRAFLRRLVQKNAEGADIAIRALGRYGGKAEETFLARARRQHPQNPTLPAAEGELAMRRLFPHHHLALLARDPRLENFEKGGLYEVWLTAIEEAVGHGARTSKELLSHLTEMQKIPPPNKDQEAYRRQLVVLVNFWRQVDLQIKATSSRPPWPDDFQQAAQILSKSSASKRFSPSTFAARVSAQVLVCSLTGRKLGYERLATQAPGVRILTPGGSRAMDGNLATAWHVAQGGTLTLEQANKKTAKSLWIMNSCPLGGGAKITAIQVRGSGGGENWVDGSSLTQQTDYFQEVPLPPEPAKRLHIEIIETVGKEPTCIAEIRVTF